MQLIFNSVEEVLAFAETQKPTPIPNEVRPGNLDPEATAKLLAVIGKGRKIQAIKLYRAIFDTNLKEALEAVDKHWPKHLDRLSF